MITREKKQTILEILQKQFSNQQKDYHTHIERVEWWNKNVIEQKEGFAQSIVKVNGINAMCFENNLMGCPYYICEFKFLPVRMNDDLGNGCGMQYTVKF
jgi:hypothetical protein